MADVGILTGAIGVSWSSCRQIIDLELCPVDVASLHVHLHLQRHGNTLVKSARQLRGVWTSSYIDREKKERAEREREREREREKKNKGLFGKTEIFNWERWEGSHKSVRLSHFRSPRVQACHW